MENNEEKTMKQLPLLPAPKRWRKIYFWLIVLILIGLSIFYYFSYQRISQVEKRLEEMRALRADLERIIEDVSGQK